jgi:hypothetical protein
MSSIKLTSERDCWMTTFCGLAGLQRFKRAVNGYLLFHKINFIQENPILNLLPFSNSLSILCSWLAVLGGFALTHST